MPYSVVRVSRVNRGAYEILTDSGDTLAAEPAGALLHRAASPLDLPAVGDFVDAVLMAELAIVHSVRSRKSAFVRRAAGTRDQPQVIAANIDTALIVCGLDSDFNARRIERYITLVREAGAEPVVVLNKVDLCPAPPTLTVPGVPVITSQATSASGISEITTYARGTVALLGSSGAGKSTIANQLLGRSLQEIGEGRGRHTTTYRQLIPLPGGGALIDTPGLRELQLWATEDSLDATFSDIASLAQGCRFRDCTHSVEPGCAVAAAVTDGSLAPERFASYQKLGAEIRRATAASRYPRSRR
jgi:ribosome biogenesis GTPase / thiamine phosphate phosphatase